LAIKEIEVMIYITMSKLMVIRLAKLKKG